ELGDEHIGKQTCPGHAAGDRPARGRRLDHLLTAAAGLLRAGDLDDLELCRDHLEDLAHVLADQAQLTAAIGAGVAEIELAALARRVCRDAGSPRWARRGV